MLHRRTAAAVALVALLLAAAAPQPAEAGVWETIENAFSDAWQATKNVFNSAKDAVECQAANLDLTSFSMDACWAAPEADLCTDACKANLDKLPESCLQGLANDVGAQGNAQITERLTEQLSACGFNITVSSALTAARTLVPALAAAAAAAVLLLSA